MLDMVSVKWYHNLNVLHGQWKYFKGGAGYLQQKIPDTKNVNEQSRSQPQGGNSLYLPLPGHLFGIQAASAHSTYSVS